jgi:uncharacterized protein
MNQMTLLHWTDPLICKGIVMHARTRPVRNVFRYPVFFVRLPLSRLDQLEVSGLSINRRGICQILNRDHGPRDGSDLYAWAKEILKANHLSEVTAGGEIILQTMPRMFGYVFNPVSFFFCYDPLSQLRAVICEVSNTFGEQHNYLVSHSDQRPINPNDRMHAKKVFHVSPFFPLTGSYDFYFGGTPDAPVAIINYQSAPETDSSSHDAAFGSGHYGLRTWLRGQSAPLTAWTLRGMVFRFPLLTLGVISRIHWQALKLWIKKVTFFSKPAPPLKETTL